MQPYVQGMSSYSEDTWDFVNKPSDIALYEDWHWLACLNIEALYSNTGHHLGLEACKCFLRTRGVAFQTHTEFVIDFLKFILEHNFFLFDGKIYKQTKGCTWTQHLCTHIQKRIYGLVGMYPGVYRGFGTIHLTDTTMGAFHL